MGKKIFISYKYGDTAVQHLSRNYSWEITKVRDYVDELQDKLEETDHLNKGEKDGEDLSNFKDETIASKLRDKIYDSSVTIVLISPNMKDSGISENDQWIPWEVSYSLKEVTREDKTSRTNGVLAVVIPDRTGNYNYMLEPKLCCGSGCTVWHTDKLFKILRENMFNKIDKTNKDCNIGDNVYTGFVSYIHMVRWDEFINNIDLYINIVTSIRDNKEDYEIKKNIV